MATVRVIFHEVFQDSQDFGSDDEHMISRVFFSTEVNGQRYDGLYADIKQTVGSSYATAPLEVSPPRGKYRGPWDYGKFQQTAEGYYRNSFGPGARAFNVSGSGIRHEE